MSIKATELLKLFTKAKQLDLSVEVREDDGDYVIRIFEMFSPKDFDKKQSSHSKVRVTGTKENIVLML